MGLWAAAIEAGGAIGSSLINTMGSSGEGTGADGGFTGSGWTGSNQLIQGHTKGPGFPTRAWRGTNSVLGTEVGKIGAGVAGSFLGDYRARRNSRNRMSDLKDEGLTPWEIAGGGGGGSSVAAQGNTLGSGPQTQATGQRAFLADQAQKERDNKLNIAKLQVGPPERQATVAEGKFGLQMNLHPMEMQKLNQTVKKIKAEVAQLDFNLKNAWELKFAGMGPENAILALATFHNGISLKRVLTAQGNMTPKEKQQVQGLINDLNKMKGAGGQALSIKAAIQQLLTGQESLTDEKGQQQLGSTQDLYRKEWELFKMRMEQTFPLFDGRGRRR